VLASLLRDETAGDPISGLKWTRKSLRRLSAALSQVGYEVSPMTVRRLLDELDYSLQVNQKQLAGGDEPERDVQFQYIASQQALFESQGWPVLSVDTKKKELVGCFKNPGRTWRHTPELVNIHDFPSEARGKAIPYGIYDVGRNHGLVVVGTSADTAQFAAEAIAIWCHAEGQQDYAQAPAVLILCDCGGSNSCRSWLWKYWLQVCVADPFDLAVVVCHFPPGASHWNPADHRLFSQISANWAGHPLTDYRTMLNYLSTSQTETGLTVRAVLVRKCYQTGLVVPDHVMEALCLLPHPLLPRWNYTIIPRPSTRPLPLPE
jgi:hypothetical protein